MYARARSKKRPQREIQVKFFGNLLKNAMPKFPSDVADVPSSFENVKKLFQSSGVPDSMKSKFSLSYLS